MARWIKTKITLPIEFDWLIEFVLFRRSFVVVSQLLRKTGSVGQGRRYSSRPCPFDEGHPEGAQEALPSQNPLPRDGHRVRPRRVDKVRCVKQPFADFLESRSSLPAPGVHDHDM